MSAEVESKAEEVLPGPERVSVGAGEPQVKVGDQQVTLEEVVSVTLFNYAVVLDDKAEAAMLASVEAAAEAARGGKKGKGGKGGKGGKKSEEAASASDVVLSVVSEDSLRNEELLTAQQARAVLFVRLVGLTRGRSAVRFEVAQLLAGLLNAGVTPVLPFAQDSAAGLRQLAAALNGGDGPAYSADGGRVPLAEAMRGAGLAPLAAPLAGAELTAFLSGGVTATAIAALAVHAASNLMETADAVAALSMEASQTAAAPLDADHHDVCRPHRGQVSSATLLRTLLGGSQQLTGSTVSDDAAKLALATIPQYHGPARDAIAASGKAVAIEVNSAARFDRGAAGAGVPLLSQPLAMTLSSLHNSLCVLGVSAVSRLTGVASSSGDAADMAGVAVADEVAAALTTQVARMTEVVSVPTFTLSLPSPAVVAAQVLEQSCKEVHRVLAVEASVAVAVLEARVPLAGSDASRAAEAAAAYAADEEAFLPEKFMEGLDDLPPAGALKKAKKLAKAAKKAADKAAKKAAKAAGAQALGQGTTALRRRLAAAVGGATGLEAYDAYLRVLDPHDPRPTGQAAFMADLAVRLVATDTRRAPKVAKGVRDMLPEQMAVRQRVISLITNVFKCHGGVAIDTPVFELKETLVGKYGEDSKLIYDLADQGGELLALRFDLTVPFARYLAQHPVGNIKRYHIAKVYRRDQPSFERGRYREFYQCDFDIAGAYDTMVPDADCIKIMLEVLGMLPIGDVVVKVNHRKLLDAYLSLAGVPTESFRAICSSIDKMDKMSWEDVRSEMIVTKGLAADVADAIRPFLALSGGASELAARLLDEGLFAEHAEGLAALKEMQLLFSYLDAMGVGDRVCFDLSLARGLHYYTGVIYEAVPTSGKVGSVAGGGRYDNLVGMFSGKSVPCVGVSMGMERLFKIAEDSWREAGLLKKPAVSVLVVGIGSGMLTHCMRIASMLWAAGFSAEFDYKKKTNMKKQIERALDDGIPFMVVLGAAEVEADTVNLKALATSEQHTVGTGELVDKLLEVGALPEERRVSSLSLT